jgi:hypothetical protein
MSKEVGVDLVAEPNAAMDPRTAYEILVVGMAKGLFTGYGLDDVWDNDGIPYLDYIEARRIVNGTDKNYKIARYAQVFEDILEESLREVKEPEQEDIPNPEKEEEFSVWDKVAMWVDRWFFT